MKRHFPLHIHISTVFLILVLLVGGVIGWFGYTTSRDMLETAAADLNQRISGEVMGEFRRILAPAEMATSLLSRSSLVEAHSLEERSVRLGLMQQALDGSPALSSIYIGYANGDFFFLRRLSDAIERQAFNAPQDASYLLQSIEQFASGPARGHFIYLDPQLRVLRDDDRPDYASGYDPRTRNWFQLATQAKGAFKTAPYLFFSNRKVGITLGTRSASTGAVVGADILLDTLGSHLSRLKVTAGTQLLLVDGQGFVVAHEDTSKLVSEAGDGKLSLAKLTQFGVPVLSRIGESFASLRDYGHQTQQMSVDGGDWRVTMQAMELEGAAPMYLVSAVPDHELLAAAIKLRSTSLLITIVIILLAAPVTWVIARGIAGPMRALVREADAIRHFDFSQPVEVSSLIDEVNELAETMDGMKTTIRRFLTISQAVAAEENFDRLLPMLLSETILAASAERGVLYLVDQEQLLPAAALTERGQSFSEGLLSGAISQQGTLLAAAIALGQPTSGVLTEADRQAIGLAAVDDASMPAYALAVPLLNRQQQLVGCLLLLRATPMDHAQISFVGALSGSAASSLETRELIKAQKELFEAFIRLIAGAIDAKSPYTGGHCERVPELTKMLAQAACAEQSGTFAEFTLGEQDWEAVHVAAWLHDCGKITTPEYVVDKATKLETIYDRIHEVRMRFEVLKREAEIRMLKAVLGGAAPEQAQQALDEELRQIDEDFAFVATCNEGGEFMAPEKIERLKTIAARTWTRTLDDRLGISYEERQRKAQAPVVTLPAQEPLLADKPEHVFDRQERDRMPEDNPWGIRMPVPELLYNKGELYNLAVARGTLTEEDRYKINEHIVQTLIMLSQLPFPKHMRQVPDIAGGHHEKIDGTGYPRRLQGEQMNPVARMMVIADIFEALTAVDRPYKKGKTLSEAIKIMSFMKKDKHLDPELFALFLRSGVYRQYAERFMKPEQIDEVDIEVYLA